MPISYFCVKNSNGLLFFETAEPLLLQFTFASVGLLKGTGSEETELVPRTRVELAKGGEPFVVALRAEEEEEGQRLMLRLVVERGGE